MNLPCKHIFLIHVSHESSTVALQEHKAEISTLLKANAILQLTTQINQTKYSSEICIMPQNVGQLKYAL